MGRRLRRLAAFLLIVTAALVSAAGWVWQDVTRSGPLAAPATVIVPRGAGLDDIATSLAGRGVIRHPLTFVVAARLSGEARALRAGEYAIPAGASVQAVLALMVEGRTVVRRLTVPEGLTSRQVVDLVMAAEGLAGEVAAIPPEGSLLPETYHYGWGDQRSQMVERMRRAMRDALAELWPARAEGLPLTGPGEAVTLASIVERETGVAAERPLVAGVFVNRLKRGMRLQSDPTVAYGLADRALDRPLTRADLKALHPWNTYLVGGLPPGPIANPGRAALEAVLRPADTDALYFVADGSGGHVFARTLAEHNRNVGRWRRLLRERGEAAPAGAGTDEPPPE